MNRKAHPYSVYLTDEQVDAINTALPGAENFAEKLRGLIAGGLSLYLVEWPEAPLRGGRRAGAGRKALRDVSNKEDSRS